MYLHAVSLRILWIITHVISIYSNVVVGKPQMLRVAKMSFEPADVARGWPDLDDLDEKAVKILDDWEKLFKRKYPAVATLERE